MEEVSEDGEEEKEEDKEEGMEEDKNNKDAEEVSGSSSGDTALPDSQQSQPVASDSQGSSTALPAFTALSSVFVSRIESNSL